MGKFLKANLPLDPNKELFRWGPIPFQVYYGDWNGLFIDFARRYPGYKWPPALLLLKEGRLIYLSDAQATKTEGRRVFVEQILPEKERAKARQGWNLDVKALEKYEEKINKFNLSTLSSNDFLEVWKTFHDLIGHIWGYGTLPEIANLGSVTYLEEILQPLVPQGERALVMEALTAPEKSSFYQQEELALSQTTDINAHQKKYFWIYNSYNNAEVATEESFLNRKQALGENLSEKLKNYFFHVKEKKREIQEKYQFASKVMEIAAGITYCINWQDERKKVIWRYIHFKELLLNEVIRRYSWDRILLLRLHAAEIISLLEGTKKIEYYEWRLKDFGILYQTAESEREIIDTEKAAYYWGLYVETKSQGLTRVLQGIVACKSPQTVRGPVKVILDPRKADTLQKGDILATSMTSPDFVYIMKKAAAIVTDTGGLMSHAAIISRELSKPCIVGTKVATQVLKDGDMVEVDTEKGSVVILKR